MDGSQSIVQRISTCMNLDFVCPIKMNLVLGYFKHQILVDIVRWSHNLPNYSVHVLKLEACKCRVMALL